MHRVDPTPEGPLVFAERVRAGRLANGLSILVEPDASIPNVALYLFYRVGSRNERPGATGLSHFFEHMMFNGTRRHGPKAFDRIMESAGGRNNAYTSQNLTVYQDWFPREAIETVLELESDRMAGLAIDPAVVESERAVVAAERRATTESDNHALLEERLWEAAFTAHPYRWPVIGWMADIAAWRVEDLVAFYRTYYTPSNALLVLVGDVDAERAMALAERTFGALPAAPPPPPVDSPEPPQRAERRVELARPAQLAAFAAGWRVPPARHPDAYPLRLLESLLLTGQSSRLYRRLVDRERAALSVSGGFDVAFDPTLFVIACEMREGESPARGETLLAEEIEAVAARGPSDEELAKARRIRLAEAYRGLKTISGRAHDLGLAEIFLGDFRELFRVEEVYAAVSPDDVRRVARTYFEPSGRSVATLVPTSGAAGPAGEARCP
jgi:zinc protease